MQTRSSQSRENSKSKETMDETWKACEASAREHRDRPLVYAYFYNSKVHGVMVRRACRPLWECALMKLQHTCTLWIATATTLGANRHAHAGFHLCVQCFELSTQWKCECIANLPCPQCVARDACECPDRRETRFLCHNSHILVDCCFLHSCCCKYSTKFRDAPVRGRMSRHRGPRQHLPRLSTRESQPRSVPLPRLLWSASCEFSYIAYMYRTTYHWYVVCTVYYVPF